MSEKKAGSVKEITYFSKPGRHNTEDTIRLAKERALELGIQHVLIATTTGKTGLYAVDVFKDTNIDVIVVAEHWGFKDEGEWLMKDEYISKLKERNVKLMTQSHPLAGIERSFSKKFGGASRTEVVAETLRTMIGSGIKVCVEISIMAADSGFIPCGPDVEIIAVGGTWGGADSAVVIRPAHMNNFFDLEIREIICVPRTKKYDPKKNQ